MIGQIIHNFFTLVGIAVVIATFSTFFDNMTR